MQHIVSLSGGKDSTAMLLMMLEEGMRVDRIISIDTTKEFPQMYKHLEKLEKYVGIPFEVVKIDFDYWFGEHVRTRGKRKGESGEGWADFRNRWCTGLKREAFLRILYGIEHLPRKRSIPKVREGFTEYIGIAADEPKRIKNAEHIRYPLYERGINEDEALQYCYDKGFDWEGLYAQGRSRVSCYCCPLQRIGELRLTYIFEPELWKNMMEMDKQSFRKFKSNYTLTELQERFEKEIEEQGVYNFLTL